MNYTFSELKNISDNYDSINMNYFGEIDHRDPIKRLDALKSKNKHNDISHKVNSLKEMSPSFSDTYDPVKIAADRLKVTMQKKGFISQQPKLGLKINDDNPNWGLKEDELRANRARSNNIFIGKGGVTVPNKFRLKAANYSDLDDVNFATWYTHNPLEEIKKKDIDSVIANGHDVKVVSNQYPGQKTKKTYYKVKNEEKGVLDSFENTIKSAKTVGEANNMYKSVMNLDRPKGQHKRSIRDMINYYSKEVPTGKTVTKIDDDKSSSTYGRIVKTPVMEMRNKDRVEGILRSIEQRKNQLNGVLNSYGYKVVTNPVTGENWVANANQSFKPQKKKKKKGK